ncbi:MAG: R.Pab1 family restriction endonuclease [Candidatus Poribacteria bacterium]
MSVSKYPMFLIEGKDYDIEINLKHKQRAVGYQAMIYVCLPLTNADGDIIGRKTKANEQACFTITKDKNNFVFDAIKAFNKANGDSPIWKDWNIETIDKKNEKHYGKKPYI